MDIRGFGDVVSLYQGRTETALKADVQRLSSGLRINTSADDPSGLAIAEKLQSKVNGLDAGARSVQDANNALNVADGALQAISDLLLRIRSLVVEGTSDLKTATDKADLQTEVDQLTREINQISQNTEFNGKKLLDGSLSSATPKPAQLLIPVNNGLTGGGTLLDQTVDPTQPSIQTAGSPQFIQTLTVDSYDSVNNLLNVTVTISSPDTATFGPPQTSQLQFVPGTNQAVTDFFGPSPGSPEFIQTTASGLPVLAFNVGTLNVNDVGKTSTVVSVDAEVKAQGQALEVNSGDAEGTTVSIDIPAVNTINLGVNDIQISDNLTNQADEYRVDYGIEKLANIRAQVGAQIVSLQESANDSNITEVNTQAAESNIRDTNIGQTTTDFVRQQILTNIQTSLLSRLYGQSSQVLQLFR